MGCRIFLQGFLCLLKAELLFCGSERKDFKIVLTKLLIPAEVLSSRIDTNTSVDNDQRVGDRTTGRLVDWSWVLRKKKRKHDSFRDRRFQKADIPASSKSLPGFGWQGKRRRLPISQCRHQFANQSIDLSVNSFYAIAPCYISFPLSFCSNL